jgi:multisubunit Na+/H+ antiporter MnhF subunit
MKEALVVVLGISIAVHIGLIAVCVWRVWRGENAVDRLLAADVIGTLFLAVLVLIAVNERNSLYIDVALGLAAPSFIATIALAHYIANHKVF